MGVIIWLVISFILVILAAHLHQCTKSQVDITRFAKKGRGELFAVIRRCLHYEIFLIRRDPSPERNGLIHYNGRIREGPLGQVVIPARIAFFSRDGSEGDLFSFGRHLRYIH